MPVCRKVHDCGPGGRRNAERMCLQVAAMLLATYRTLVPWLRDDQVSSRSPCLLSTVAGPVVHILHQKSNLCPDAGAGATAQGAHGWASQRWPEVRIRSTCLRRNIQRPDKCATGALCCHMHQPSDVVCRLIMQDHAAWNTSAVTITVRLAVNAAASAAT
jgi:hypothetical protein